MTKERIEKIIHSIQEADECEIMEFDFDECFQFMRDGILTIDKCIEYLCKYEKLITSEQTRELHKLATRFNPTWKT